MTEEQELLSRAAAEISSLRRENELMKARLSTFDSLMQVLYTQPYYQPQGFSPDIIHEINKRLNHAV